MQKSFWKLFRNLLATFDSKTSWFLPSEHYARLIQFQFIFLFFFVCISKNARLGRIYYLKNSLRIFKNIYYNSLLSFWKSSTIQSIISQELISNFGFVRWPSETKVVWGLCSALLCWHVLCHFTMVRSAQR